MALRMLACTRSGKCSMTLLSTICRQKEPPASTHPFNKFRDIPQRLAISHFVPRNWLRSAATSSSVSTTGRRTGRFARVMPSSHGSSTPRTSL